jgi:serine/threonine protein kinase
LGITEFEFLVCLGKGACGEVYLVRSRVSGCILALKRVRKDTITTYNSLMTQFRERKSMIQLGSNPYTVTLHAAF